MFYVYTIGGLLYGKLTRQAKSFYYLNHSQGRDKNLQGPSCWNNIDTKVEQGWCMKKFTILLHW
jgi:hypothetical protein